MSQTCATPYALGIQRFVVHAKERKKLRRLQKAGMLLRNGKKLPLALSNETSRCVSMNLYRNLPQGMKFTGGAAAR